MKYKDHILIGVILVLIGFIGYDKYWKGSDTSTPIQAANTKSSTASKKNPKGSDTPIYSTSPEQPAPPPPEIGLSEGKAKKLLEQHFSELATNDYLGSLTIDDLSDEENIYTVRGKFLFDGAFGNKKRPYSAKIIQKEKNGKTIYEVDKACYFVDFQVEWRLKCTDGSKDISPLPNKQ